MGRALYCQIITGSFSSCSTEGLESIWFIPMFLKHKEGKLGQLAPKGLKPLFSNFFRRFRAAGPFPKPSPSLEVEFPVRSSFFLCFSSFLPGLESREPLFEDLGCLFYDPVRGATAANPLRPISAPCSIEKCPSSRMTNHSLMLVD